MPAKAAETTKTNQSAAPIRQKELATAEQAQHYSESGTVASLLRLQRTYGNRFVQRVIQAKLEVSRPGDPYEREADEVAERIIAMPVVPAQAVPLQRNPLPLARQPVPVEKDEEKSGHAKASRVSEQDAPNGVLPHAEEAVAVASNSVGQPLPANLQRKFEHALGADLSGVRVHTSPESVAANKAISARAYTTGRAIHFNQGQYRPESSEGEHLLAHEVVHTVQQSMASGALQFKLEASMPGDAAEIEADRVADAIISAPGGLSRLSRPPSGERDPGIQRAWSDADPGSYTPPQSPNQPATPQGGWNAGNQTVAGMERIPLEGLKQGLQTDTEKAGGPTNERDTGKAIAVVPAGLKPGQPVEIFLHLHGHNIGYRERSTASKGDGPSMVEGTVRDVAADRIEQQMGAAGRNMIGILPQGTQGSGFGAFHADAYIAEVWDKLVAMKKLPPDAKRGPVILSGHSGAAAPIVKMLQEGTVPTGLGELVLFDSIHAGQRGAVENFLKGRMGADVKALKDMANPSLNGGLDAAVVASHQREYLAGSFRFRGIFTPKYHPQQVDDKGKPIWQDPPTNKKPLYDETRWVGYGVEYEPLRDTIKSWIDSHSKGLDAGLVAALRENYKVTPAGTGVHNTIMSANDNLQGALGALPGASPPTPAPAPVPATPTAPAVAPPKTGALESAPKDDAASEVASTTENTVNPAAGSMAQTKRLPLITPRPTPDYGFEVASRPIDPEMVNLPLRADNVATRNGGKLQRSTRLQFTQNVIQRDPPPAAPVLTDEQQWEQDWNSHTRQQSYFNDSSRPSGTPRQRYDILCPMYKSKGIPRPMLYLATSVTDAKFYNFTTPAHADLAAALAAAEATLKGQGYAQAPVKSVWALNVRTTSNGTWSNHADGKAVDLDPDDNPHLIEEKERKVISVVTGTDMEQGSQGYDVMKGVSDRFKADYNAAGLGRRVTELGATEKTKETERDAAKSEHETLTRQRDQLRSERGELKKQLKAVPHGKKAMPEDEAKATELKGSIQQKETDLAQVEREIKDKSVEIKKKEAALKAATKDRELVEKELTKYEATEKAVSDLESTVKSLPDEVKALDDQIAQSKQDEQDARSANNPTGAQAQQKLRAKLEQASTKKKAELKRKQDQLDKKKKERDKDPLRHYADNGILNLKKDVVEAMIAAGLKWGGNWKGAKDFMHFEL